MLQTQIVIGFVAVVIAIVQFDPSIVHASEPGIAFSVRHWDGTFITGAADPSQNTPFTSAIYTIRADGSGLHPLLDLGGVVDNPKIASDGYVYFQSNAMGNHSWIGRIRPDGTQLQDLTEGNELSPGADALGFYVSQDSTKITYISHDGTAGYQSIMNANGSGARYLNQSLGYTYMGAFNPSASKIVMSGPSQNYRLILINENGSNPITLTPDYTQSYAPQFTPDGLHVVFTRNDGDIYRVNVTTLNTTSLTTGNNYYEFHLSPSDAHGSTDFPSISPDGSKIAYISRASGSAQVWTMNIDGTDQQQITSLPSDCGRAVWSADGSEINFISFTSANSTNLFSVDASGLSAPQRLTYFGDGYSVYLFSTGMLPEPAAMGMILLCGVLSTRRVIR